MANAVQLNEALRDIGRSFLASAIWVRMGIHDIKLRYRGSALGPIWLMAGVGITVVAVGLLYSEILRVPPSQMVTFLAAGLICALFVFGCVSDGCQAFLANAAMMRQMATPIYAFVLRMVWRNSILFAHNFVVFLLTTAIYGVLFKINILLALAGMLIVVANCLWISAACGLIATRFRDFIQISIYTLQFLMIFTPIYWLPSLVSRNTLLLDVNPLFHLVEVVRQPLLGAMPTALNYGVAIGLMLVGATATLFAFARYRRRIVFWL